MEGDSKKESKIGCQATKRCYPPASTIPTKVKRHLRPIPCIQSFWPGMTPLSLFFFFQYFKKFIHLAVPGLSCGTQDLPSSLQHVGSLVVACKLLVAACGI